MFCSLFSEVVAFKSNLIYLFIFSPYDSNLQDSLFYHQVVCHFPCGLVFPVLCFLCGLVVKLAMFLSPLLMFFFLIMYELTETPHTQLHKTVAKCLVGLSFSLEFT